MQRLLLSVDETLCQSSTVHYRCSWGKRSLFAVALLKSRGFCAAILFWIPASLSYCLISSSDTSRQGAAAITRSYDSVFTHTGNNLEVLFFGCSFGEEERSICNPVFVPVGTYYSFHRSLIKDAWSIYSVESYSMTFSKFGVLSLDVYRVASWWLANCYEHRL